MITSGCVGIAEPKKENRYKRIKEAMKKWLADQILFVITIMLLVGFGGGLLMAKKIADYETGKIVKTKVLLYKDEKGADAIYELKQRL